jgi:rhodanese-related sulfurtransferase
MTALRDVRCYDTSHERMNIRRHLLEAFTIIAAAIVCAVVANAMASRERKLVLVGNYPNAQKVPSHSAEPLVPVMATTAETTTAATTTVATLPVALPPVTSTTAAVTSTVAPAATTTTAPKVAAVKTPVAPAPVAEDPLKRFPAHPDKPYVELHGDDVAWLHSHGALFLDARRTSVYEQGHITGARTFSVWESDVDDKVNKLYEERNDPRAQLQPIVIYCSGGDCEDSHMLAQKLWGVQFNNLYVYKDGFPDWQKRGGPAKTGSAP